MNRNGGEDLEDNDEYYRNLTIDGVQCDGLIFETVGASEEASGNDIEEDTDEDLNPGASTSAEYEHQCFVCSFETDTERRMKFHMITAHSFVSCHVCTKTYTTREEMIEHIDKEHHKEDVSSDEEDEFQRNIKRQSTAVKSNSYSKLVVEFVADAQQITDLKKKRRRGT